MSEPIIILVALSDNTRADRLMDALAVDGQFLPTLDAVAEGVDVSVSDTDGVLSIAAGAPGEEANATLPPDADDALIIAAARLVAAGYRISLHDHDDHAIAFEEAEPSPLKATLSAREVEVLNLLADGAQNKVIARALDISVHTAKFHVASLLTKLGASNRTDAIAIAMREGLVSM